jgi:hypothetical protein
MGLRTRVAFILVGLVIPTAGAAEPTATLVPLTVRVYNSAAVAPGDLGRALETADRAVSDTAVALDWRICGGRATGPGGDGSDGCEAALLPGELIIRIVSAPATPVTPGYLPLGDALIDTDARDGVLATIYADRVRRTAREAQIDEPTLLGRAVAHELGHLLMASTAHGARGLMRAAWLQRELRRNQPDDWVFAPSEAAIMHDRAARARTPCPVAVHRPE